MREEMKVIHQYIDENISNTAGIYLTSGEGVSAAVSTNLAESAERWKTLVAGGQKRILEYEIEEFLKDTE